MKVAFVGGQVIAGLGVGTAAGSGGPKGYSTCCQKVGPRYGTKGEKTKFENMKFYLWGLIALGIKNIHTKFQSTDFCGC